MTTESFETTETTVIAKFDDEKPVETRSVDPTTYTPPTYGRYYGDTLDDVFIYCDIAEVTYKPGDDETPESVRLLARNRRTGEEMLVEGIDLPHAVEAVLDRWYTNERMLDEICDDWGLSYKELHELVDAAPPFAQPEEVSRPGPDILDVVAELGEPVRGDALALAAAQPFVLRDKDQVYLVMIAPIDTV